MSIKKIDLEAEKLIEASSRLRALAHPVRIAIINLLDEKGEANVTEIYESLGIRQASVSHHLYILKVNNILMCHKKGRMIYYKIKTDAVLQIMECVNKCNR